VLSDGIYDAFVLSAELSKEKNALSVELVITDGPHRGDVVAVLVYGAKADPDALVGLPCRLEVEEGRPRLS
jgi:hypothetical protein